MRPATSRITPNAPSPVHTISMSGPRRSANAGRRRASILGTTRIGVHAGRRWSAISRQPAFFDYTAYGDTINTAARLEAANKFLGTRICVSAVVADGAGDFRGRPVGDLVLRGRSEPLRAYEAAAGGDVCGARDVAIFRSLRQARGGDATAMPAFAALVGLHADDALAGFHLKTAAQRPPRACGCSWNKQDLEQQT